MTDEATPDAPVAEEDIDHGAPPDKGADVYERMAWVQNALTAVAKTRRDGGPKYAFRGIDDVINALHPLLGQAGLIISPKVIHHHIEDHTWSPGTDREKKEPAVITTVVFRVMGRDGSYLPRKLCPEVPGYGVDSSLDKGPGKALSYAYKIAISQLFSLPTDDPSMDNEMRNQPEETGWGHGWSTKAAHDDARAEMMEGLKSLKALDEKAFGEIKGLMVSQKIMGDDGRVVKVIPHTTMRTVMASLEPSLHAAEAHAAAEDSQEPQDAVEGDTTTDEPADPETSAQAEQEAPLDVRVLRTIREAAGEGDQPDGITEAELGALFPDVDNPLLTAALQALKLQSLIEETVHENDNGEEWVEYLPKATPQLKDGDS